ncbi:Flp pilus assembly protein TadD [Motilibacter rhizosphaerae]|uniref:Flp pilus assembly protein TadD n=1 Tax=Motilibacter rhizosphaerae TaxID=598652 RepID=A0A4Q7NTG4_9ACTN|nr:hypothetical protein [Motilibacter rhizosphaerae]RZS89682.1 Flp pilus assembly protein TadD [Motilibacter rhizosphaerae]
MRRAFPVVSILLAVVLGVSAVLLATGTGRSSARQRAAADVSAPDQLSGSSDAALAALQHHLALQPKDSAGWASLAAAYVARARLTSEPTYYPKADAAVQQSLRLQADGNVPGMVASAALHAARHDFSGALASAQKAVAAAPDSADAYLVEVDALEELGRYAEAERAAERADDLRPGVSTFSRLSYLAELRGDIPAARRLMTMALDDATLADDKAFAHVHLGALDRQTGDLAGAEREYAASLQAEPGYVPAMAAQAQALGARGKVDQAVALYEQVVTKMPLAEYLLAYGELLDSVGRHQQAQVQYAVVKASAQLARANGVDADLEVAHYEADHGSPAAALQVARAEWDRRHCILSADALGWALHAAGRDREAVPYLLQATALGTKDARVLYHLGTAQIGAGQKAAGKRTLQRALALEPTFSPLYAPAARRALSSLGA